MRAPTDTRHSTFHAEPFTNNVGQVLNPGDNVVCFARGWGGNSHIYRGTYLGTRVGTAASYQSGKVIGLSVRVKEASYRWVDKDGTPCSYGTKGARQERYEHERNSCFFLKRVYALR
jgi:hypothetical protein